METVGTKEIIKAIITNPQYSEDEKSLLVEELLEKFHQAYPELKHHATKADVKESELKLVQKIEETKKETKEIELKLTQEIEEVRKEIKEIELKLSKEIDKTHLEIEEVRKEIKEIELKLSKEIEKSKNETIKWVAIMLFGQIFAIASVVAGIFKLFLR